MLAMPLIGTVLWDISRLYNPGTFIMIPLLLTVVLSFISDPCNNKDMYAITIYAKLLREKVCGYRVKSPFNENVSGYRLVIYVNKKENFYLCRYIHWKTFHRRTKPRRFSA